MLAILLSPAKNLDESHSDKSHSDNLPIHSPLNPLTKPSRPIFAEFAEQHLLPLLQKKSIEEIGKLMKISEKLSTMNHHRYQNWFEAQEKQAVYLFNGDVYEGLNAKKWTELQKNNASRHLYILSGFYGVIRPFDLIKPYRLEMGTKAEKLGLNALTMAHYWREKLNNYFVHGDFSNQQDQSIIINLASNEYSQAIHEKLSEQKNVITVIFENMKKDGSFGVVGIHAKKARGLFASYLLQTHNLTQIADENTSTSEKLIDEKSLWSHFDAYDSSSYTLYDIRTNKNGWEVVYRSMKKI